MDILVGVHVGGDYNSDITAAKISLDANLIKAILKIRRRVKQGECIVFFDNTPDLGTSDLNLNDQHIWNLAKLSKEEFRGAFEAMPDEGRSDIVQIHVDSMSFWWGGVFKHTDVHWETRMIPLSFLPQPAAKPAAKKVQSGTDLNMTAEEMNSIHEKIAQGISSGLNAREIERTFNRHVTKAQLIRCMMELIDRDHN